MKTEFIEIAESARILGKSRATVYRMITAGKLTPMYRPTSPRIPLFRRADVESLVVPGPWEPVMNAKLHRQARNRDNNLCVICYSDRHPMAHHVVPVEMGGVDSLENLATLCYPCHVAAHRKGRILLKKGKQHGTLAVVHWILKSAGLPTE